MEEQPSKRRRRSNRSSGIDRDGRWAELISLLESITADGTISEEEAHYLQKWLAEQSEADFPGRSLLGPILEHALADGILTEKEKREIYRAIEKVLPADLRFKAKERRTARETVEKMEREAEKEKQRAIEEERRLRSTPLEIFDFVLAGVSHKNRASLIREFATAGDVVFLSRERTNPHDSNAVAVYLANGAMIGYAPRESAANLAPLLDQGCKHKSWIKKILRGSNLPIPVIYSAIYRPDTDVPDAMLAGDPPPMSASLKARKWKSNAGCGCLSILLLYLIVSIFTTARRR